MAPRLEPIAIHMSDGVDADRLGARRLTLPVPAAIAETLLVHACHHGEHPSRALRLSLGQQAEVGDLRRSKERSGGVRARRDARAAADAGRRVHRRIGIVLRNKDGIAVWRTPGGSGDESSARDDPIESAAVNDEILDHWESRRT